MELNVLLWILGGGFAGTWGLCIFFMNRTDAGMFQMRSEMSLLRTEIKADIAEIRREISELYHCVKDHHGRLCVLEDKEKK